MGCHGMSKKKKKIGSKGNISGGPLGFTADWFAHYYNLSGVILLTLPKGPGKVEVSFSLPKSVGMGQEFKKALSKARGKKKDG